MKRTLTYIFLALLLNACEVKPKAIAYGQQACDFCRMTIVDKQHAAQLVTDKGKVYNFDATECMVHFLRRIDTTSVGLLLVTDYNRPETLIDAKKATFIISEAIPSPMGANLSALPSREEAEKLLATYNGRVYPWDELLEYLNK